MSDESRSTTSRADRKELLSKRGRRPVGGPFWLALGAVPIALTALAGVATSGTMEKDLSGEVRGVLERAAYSPAAVTFDGRDAKVYIDTDDEATVQALANSVDGVRLTSVFAADEAPEDAVASDDSTAKPAGDETTSDDETTDSSDDSDGEAVEANAYGFTVASAGDTTTVKAAVNSEADKTEMLEVFADKFEAVEGSEVDGVATSFLSGENTIETDITVDKSIKTPDAEALAGLVEAVAGQEDVKITGSGTIALIKGEFADADAATAARAALTELAGEDIEISDKASVSEDAEEEESEDDKEEDKDEAKPGECSSTIEELSAAAEALKVNFRTGSARVMDQSTTSLNNFAIELAGCAQQEDIEVFVLVSGHTDSSGSDEANNALSLQRAKTVKGVLVSKGVDSGDITTVGQGESNPIAENDSEEGKAKNRRVEIRVS